MRRSCQTIARASGSPVRCDQKQIVSRWLVIPIAAIRAGAAGRVDHRLRAGEALLPDLLRVMLDPARPRIMLRQLALLDAQARPVRARTASPACWSCPHR